MYDKNRIEEDVDDALWTLLDVMVALGLIRNNPYYRLNYAGYDALTGRLATLLQLQLGEHNDAI